MKSVDMEIMYRGLYEEAVKSFEAALVLMPRSARALFHLGNAQFALQLYAQAERSFESALQVWKPSLALSSTPLAFAQSSCVHHPTMA